MVTDPAGNSSATSDEAKFTVDTTAPGDSNDDGKVDGGDKMVVNSMWLSQKDKCRWQYHQCWRS
ncbi:hypothetical protein INT80_14505 [Gallibacterium anatis]|uniref:Uncharacterized protein n=1 Tax=Gallibacterium anatis TaxID=750 RepID=A0A930UTM1_9PAST|nr:hypothetical protein [Gallibacterium anatis]